MKRHEALRPISRDHHEVLMLARDLRRLATDPALEDASTRASFRAQWGGWMGTFFAASSGALAALTGPEELHARAREGADRVSAGVADALALEDVSRDTLARLGQELHDEVRWRERVFFPALEASASAAELEALATRWRDVEATRARSRGTCEER